MKIIQTQGTRNSQGSFMVLFDEDKEVYLSDNKGNNAFDTYQEALQVIKDLVLSNYEKLEFLHCFVQELQKGNQLADSDLKTMLEFVEDLREPYLIAKGETKQ